LRMLLVLSGLPRPQAQVKLHDDKGLFLGRPDLYYPTHRLALEYDGATHRTSLVEDNRRQNRLVNAGIRLLRFTAGDVLHNPESVVTQVRGYLSSRPVLPGESGGSVCQPEGEQHPGGHDAQHDRGPRDARARDHQPDRTGSDDAADR